MAEAVWPEDAGAAEKGSCFSWHTFCLALCRCRLLLSNVSVFIFDITVVSHQYHLLLWYFWNFCHYQMPCGGYINPFPHPINIAMRPDCILYILIILFQNLLVVYTVFMWLWCCRLLLLSMALVSWYLAGIVRGSSASGRSNLAVRCRNIKR